MLAKQLPRASSIGLPIVEEFRDTSFRLQDSYRTKPRGGDSANERYMCNVKAATPVKTHINCPSVMARTREHVRLGHPN